MVRGYAFLKCLIETENVPPDAWQTCQQQSHTTETMDHDKRKRTSAVSIPLASILFLALIYVGCYFALVKPVSYNSLKSIGRGPPPASRKVARYRLGGGLAETIFRPLNCIDQRIRQDTWH